MDYFLIDNPLTPDPTDFRAVTKHEKTITLEEIIDLIDYRSVGVSRAEIITVFEEYTVAIKRYLKEGRKIQTPLFTLRPTVAGVFTDINDTYDSSRHGINLKLQATDELEEVTRFIEPKKISPDANLAVIKRFYNVTTDSYDDVITPGQPAKILGDNLRVDPADPQQGVYVVQQSNDKKTPVTVFVDNLPSKLAVVMPTNLPKDDYSIRVRALVGKQLQTAEYPGTLKVM